MNQITYLHQAHTILASVNTSNLPFNLDSKLITVPNQNEKGVLNIYYGNCGGPGTDPNAIPVDALDCACYFHDHGLHRVQFIALTTLISVYFITMSAGANSYIQKIQSITFGIVEPIYMNFTNAAKQVFSLFW